MLVHSHDKYFQQCSSFLVRFKNFWRIFVKWMTWSANSSVINQNSDGRFYSFISYKLLFEKAGVDLQKNIALSSFRLQEKGLTTKNYTSDEKVKTETMKWLKKIVNKILRGRDTWNHSMVEHRYWEKRWLCLEKGMWFTGDQLHFDLW